MKRWKYLIGALLLLTSAVTPAIPVTAAGANLIANPSVETTSGSNPAQWAPNSWGTNLTTLTHPTEGHTGSRSVRADMLSRTDGDAKWMHDAVTVTPGTTYTYTSYYKSNVATEIDLQYTSSSNVVSYEFVQVAPASSNWEQLTATFTVPANITKVVVMHVIADVGWLQADDFSLTANDTPPPDEDNLVANPSLETANGTVPASWQQNKWGTNTAQFTYETTGRTGNRSVKTQITQYTSGDAKWHFDPVAVVPGKTYYYRDYYKATVSTRVVAVFINGSGTASYQELDPTVPASDWGMYDATFTVPANTAQASVYHVIDAVGSLTLDDATLSVAPATPPTDIPNSSLEQANANGSAPAHWQQNKWGANTASFEYANEGHTGNRSVKVTLANYASGDAKWYFNPITTLTPGQQYRFSVWYKTNITPHAVLMYQNADGSTGYFGMPNPQPNGSANWQQYTNTFTVPTGATAVSAFLFMSENGWLQTDDYSLAEYSPTGFSRPLLSLTFDDGEEDNIDTALPEMNGRGIKSTQCFATMFVEGFPEQVNQVLAFRDSGHEICSHTVNHPFLTTLSSADLTYELQHSKQFLESITGVTVRNFASPYGDYNTTVNAEITNHYRAHRTVDEGYNSKDNFDIYRLRVQNILDTTTATEVQEWVQKAQADNTWLILVYHRVADDPGPYDTTPALFDAHLNVIQASGITVKTLNDALDEVTAQL